MIKNLLKNFISILKQMLLLEKKKPYVFPKLDHLEEEDPFLSDRDFNFKSVGEKREKGSSKKVRNEMDEYIEYKSLKGLHLLKTISKETINSKSADRLERKIAIYNYYDFTWSNARNQIAVYSIKGLEIYEIDKNPKTLFSIEWEKSPIPDLFNIGCVLSDLDSVVFTKRDFNDIFIYSLKKKKIINTLIGHSSPDSSAEIVYSANNRYIASRGDEKTFLWDLELNKRYDFNGAIYISFSPDCSLFAAAHKGKIEIGRLLTMDIVKTLSYDMIEPRELVFSRDNRFLVLCGDSHFNYLLETSEYNENIIIKPDLKKSYYKKKFTKEEDEKLSDKSIRLWNLKTDELYKLQEECGYTCGAAAFSSYSGLLLGASSDAWSDNNPIVLWETDTLKKINVIKKEARKYSPATPADILEFNYDGSLFAVNNGLESRIDIYGI